MSALEYDVLTSTSHPNLLVSLVRRALADGWRLQGGVSVSSATGCATALFCQAIVRGEES